MFFGLSRLSKWIGNILDVIVTLKTVSNDEKYPPLLGCPVPHSILIWQDGNASRRSKWKRELSFTVALYAFTKSFFAGTNGEKMWCRRNIKKDCHWLFNLVVWSAWKLHMVCLRSNRQMFLIIQGFVIWWKLSIELPNNYILIVCCFCKNLYRFFWQSIVITWCTTIVSWMTCFTCESQKSKHNRFNMSDCISRLTYYLRWPITMEPVYFQLCYIWPL